MLNPFVFDRDAAVNALVYIARRVPDPTFLRVVKVLYFADRKHLERYGRFITGDAYQAMKHGPVPSEVYTMLKAARLGRLGEGPFRVEERASNAGDVLPVPVVVPLVEPDLGALSESDLECLDAAIAEYGRKPVGELSRLSHDAAWDAAGDNDLISVEDIVATFDNPGPLLEHLRNPHP